MNFNVSSYHCWYCPQYYPKLTYKLKKQKPTFSGVPAISGPTTCIRSYIYSMYIFIQFLSTLDKHSYTFCNLSLKPCNFTIIFHVCISILHSWLFSLQSLLST